MADEIQIVKVKMPNGDVLEVDMPTVKWVNEMNTTYSGGTVAAPWSEIMKMAAAQEYLKQHGGTA